MGAAYGSAGERCMALPVVVPVGEETAEVLRARLVEAIAELRVGTSFDADAHYGPVVTAAHKARIEDYIQVGVDEGAELVVDGRGFTLPGHEDGFFLKPCLFDRVTAEERKSAGAGKRGEVSGGHGGRRSIKKKKRKKTKE